MRPNAKERLKLLNSVITAHHYRISLVPSEDLVAAIEDTLAELKQYRALLVKCSDALATGYTNEQLKVIENQYRGCSMGWMAHWALYIREVLADEEVKQT